MESAIISKFKKVELVDLEGRTLLATTDVRTDEEENRIQLHGKDFEYIDTDTLVTAVGYMEDGILLMDAVVTISTDMQTNIEILKTHEKQERRTSLKVRTSFRTRIVKVRLNRPNARIMYQNTEIETKDLSMGGIGFFANRAFFKNQLVDIIMNQVKPGMTLRAKILRRKELRDSGWRYRYGCEFVRLTPEDERAICEFVFKAQLIEYQRLKELEIE